MRLISNDINNLYNILRYDSESQWPLLPKVILLDIYSFRYICVLHKYNTYNERGVHSTTYSIKSVSCLNKKEWIYILLVLILYTNFRY